MTDHHPARQATPGGFLVNCHFQFPFTKVHTPEIESKPCTCTFATRSYGKFEHARVYLEMIPGLFVQLLSELSGGSCPRRLSDGGIENTPNRLCTRMRKGRAMCTGTPAALSCAVSSPSPKDERQEPHLLSSLRYMTNFAAPLLMSGVAASVAASLVPLKKPGVARAWSGLGRGC